LALNAKSATGGAPKFSPPMEAGTYPARLVAVLDCGLQPQSSHKYPDKKPGYEIMTTWEFVDEFLQDENGEPMPDKPRWVSESFVLYNLDSDKAISTKRYLALDPHQLADGDWVKLLNSPAMVTVTQSAPGKGGRIYENIAAVAAMREKDAAKCPPLLNKPRSFDLAEPDLETFLSLPRYVQDKIKSNLEFAGSPLAKMLEEMGSGEPPKKDEAQPKPVAKAAVSEEDRPY
jgi:hypothetical protein